jgi:hypothetical protein
LTLLQTSKTVSTRQPTGYVPSWRFTSHSNDAWRQDLSFQYVEAIVGRSLKLGARGIVWQGCHNGRPMVNFTVRTSAHVCGYPRMGFYPSAATIQNASAQTWRGPGRGPDMARTWCGSAWTHACADVARPCGPGSARTWCGRPNTSARTRKDMLRM